MSYLARWHLLPALGLVFVLTAAVSCGTNGLHDPNGSDLGPASPAEAADVRAEAQHVYDSFAGTAAQQNAGFVVKAYLVNGPMDLCLDKKGYPDWDWSLSRGYSAPYDALRPTEWFADPGRRTYSEHEVALRDYLDAEAKMNADDERPIAYDQAIDDCLKSVERPSDDEVGRASRPEQAAALIDTWRATMRRAGADLGGDVTSYVGCMDSADLSFLSRGDVDYDDLAPAMASEAGKAGPPPTPGQAPATYSSAWSHFLDLEKQVVQTDAECRKDVYTRQIANLGPVIDSFAATHATEIELAQQGWAAIVDRAAELGYHGQTGPLGK